MNRMKELREELNLSRAQVSRDLQMPYTTYVNYENEAREPNSEVLILVANYFKVSVDYLIGRTEIRKETHLDYSNAFHISDHEKEVVIGYRKQVSAVQDAVDRMLGVIPLSEQKEKRA